MYFYPKKYIYNTERPRDVIANELYYDIRVSEFELQWHYYVHFRINTIGKSLNPLISRALD